MPRIITSLCTREARCVAVCPVECIVPGKPEGEWPWYYINPDDCIDCGACEEECPKDAIFEDAVILREHKEHTDAIAINRRFFEEGPGYKAKEM